MKDTVADTARSAVPSHYRIERITQEPATALIILCTQPLESGVTRNPVGISATPADANGKPTFATHQPAWVAAALREDPDTAKHFKIGRASCRERVYVLV